MASLNIVNKRRYAGGLNIRGVVEQMMQDEQFLLLMNNPLAQFGPIQFPFLGATILPEKEVPENAFVEENIEYRTVIANDGTRYSPVQIKGSMLYGSFQVILGNSDIGANFTSQDYDAFVRALERWNESYDTSNTRPSMEAVAGLLQWVDLALLRPLLIKNEKQRFEALVNAQVVRTGDGGYYEVVNFPNPSGHRVNVAGTWSDNSYDPYPDIVNMVEFLHQKGYQVSRIVSSTPVIAKLTNNINIRTRVGRVSITAGIVAGLAGRANLDEINKLLSMDDIPPIEKYDIQYRTQNGTAYYLDRTVMMFLCATGRDMRIDLGDAQPLVMQDVLGYVGIGRPAGANKPGRVLDMQSFTDKPPRIKGEGWQTSFPVPTTPEGVGVLKGIS